MPLLDIEFQKFPSFMLQGFFNIIVRWMKNFIGQLEKVIVEFKNSGKSGLTNIKVKLLHPSNI